MKQEKVLNTVTMRIRKWKFFFSDYLKESEIWYEKLLNRMQKYLYENNGPIIMVQIENEYGSFDCDHIYTQWLHDETKKYVGDKAVLFTTDIPEKNAIQCGRIPNVFTALNFGIGRAHL